MTLLYLEDLADGKQELAINDDSTIEHEGFVYTCVQDPSYKAVKGDRLLIMQQGQEPLWCVADYTENGSLFAICQKGSKIDDISKAKVFTPLASLGDVEMVRESIKSGCHTVIKEIQRLPALTMSIIYSKKFTIKTSYGSIEFNCLITDGHINATLVLDGEKSECKFSYMAKHEKIEKKLGNKVIYKLFGEELVYIRNRIINLIPTK